jgi:6-phosphogluconolactonase
MTGSFETIVRPPEELAQVFVERLMGLGHRAHAEKRPFAIALPGGSVAEAFCPVLARAPVDWTLIEWFWSDERAVPPDHPDSNYRLAFELLLSRAPIDPQRVHRMKANGDDLDGAAVAYEAELVNTLGAQPRVDVVLLGVGSDGHVCSLFPDHPALEEASRLVIPVTDSPKPPPRRLTLTLPALAGAFAVIAAFGASKASVIHEALSNPASRLPVALAARTARRTLILLDEGAAGLSTGTDDSD